MHVFHYNYIKRKFDAKFLFTDTDSLTYEIKIDNVYEDYNEGKYLFDFSNYLNDLKIDDPSSMHEIGEMSLREK